MHSAIKLWKLKTQQNITLKTFAELQKLELLGNNDVTNAVFRQVICNMKLREFRIDTHGKALKRVNVFITNVVSEQSNAYRIKNNLIFNCV